MIPATVKQFTLTSIYRLLNDLREAGKSLPVDGHIEIHLRNGRPSSLKSVSVLVGRNEVQKSEMLDSLP